MSARGCPDTATEALLVSACAVSMARYKFKYLNNFSIMKRRHTFHFIIDLSVSRLKMPF